MSRYAEEPSRYAEGWGCDAEERLPGVAAKSEPAVAGVIWRYDLDVEKNQTTLQQVLSRLTGKPIKERLDARCVCYARDHGVPQTIIEMLDECAFAGPIQIGNLWLSRLAEFEEENAPYIRHGFLIVGTGFIHEFWT